MRTRLQRLKERETQKLVADDSAERRSYFGYVGSLPAHK